MDDSYSDPFVALIEVMVFPDVASVDELVRKRDELSSLEVSDALDPLCVTFENADSDMFTFSTDDSFMPCVRLVFATPGSSCSKAAAIPWSGAIAPAMTAEGEG